MDRRLGLRGWSSCWPPPSWGDCCSSSTSGTWKAADCGGRSAGAGGNPGRHDRSRPRSSAAGREDSRRVDSAARTRADPGAVPRPSRRSTTVVPDRHPGAARRASCGCSAARRTEAAIRPRSARSLGESRRDRWLALRGQHQPGPRAAGRAGGETGLVGVRPGPDAAKRRAMVSVEIDAAEGLDGVAGEQRLAVGIVVLGLAGHPAALVAVAPRGQDRRPDPGFGGEVPRHHAGGAPSDRGDRRRGPHHLLERRGRAHLRVSPRGGAGARAARAPGPARGS